MPLRQASSSQTATSHSFPWGTTDNRTINQRGQQLVEQTMLIGVRCPCVLAASPTSANHCSPSPACIPQTPLSWSHLAERLSPLQLQPSLGKAYYLTIHTLCISPKPKLAIPLIWMRCGIERPTKLSQRRLLG